MNSHFTLPNELFDVIFPKSTRFDSGRASVTSSQIRLSSWEDEAAWRFPKNSGKVQGGPQPVVNGVITPIRRVLIPATHLFKAIYKAWNSLYNVRLGAHLVRFAWKSWHVRYDLDYLFLVPDGYPWIFANGEGLSVGFLANFFHISPTWIFLKYGGISLTKPPFFEGKSGVVFDFFWGEISGRVWGRDEIWPGWMTPDHETFEKWWWLSLFHHFHPLKSLKTDCWFQPTLKNMNQIDNLQKKSGSGN